MTGCYVKALYRKKVTGLKPHGQKSNHANDWCDPARIRSLDDFDNLNAPGLWLLKP